MEMPTEKQRRWPKGHRLFWLLKEITNMENRKIAEIHIENDKTFCPFLLSCSFNGLLKFEGSFLQNGILYFQFSPKLKALELIDQLETKTEPHIPTKDIFEAIDTFWQRIAKSKRNGAIKHGGNQE